MARCTNPGGGSALTRGQAQMGLATISEVERLLGGLDDPVQVMDVLQQARSMATVAVATQLAKLHDIDEVDAVRRHGVESWLWASRRLGQLLKATKLSKSEAGSLGGRGNKKSSPATGELLSQRASEFRELADIPVATFRKRLQSCRDEQVLPTRDEMLGKSKKKKAKKKAGPKKKPKAAEIEIAQFEGMLAALKRLNHDLNALYARAAKLDDWEARKAIVAMRDDHLEPMIPQYAAALKSAQDGWP